MYTNAAFLYHLVACTCTYVAQFVYMLNCFCFNCNLKVGGCEQTESQTKVPPDKSSPAILQGADKNNGGTFVCLCKNCKGNLVDISPGTCPYTKQIMMMETRLCIVWFICYSQLTNMKKQSVQT